MTMPFSTRPPLVNLTSHNQMCVPHHMKIRAVWSGPSLSTNRIIAYYRMYEWRAKAQMILCACAEWSETMTFTHPCGTILEFTCSILCYWWIQRGFGRFSWNLFRLKISFSWELLDAFDKFGIPYLPKIFTLLTLYRIVPFTRPFYYLSVCVKLLVEWQTK